LPIEGRSIAPENTLAAQALATIKKTGIPLERVAISLSPPV